MAYVPDDAMSRKRRDKLTPAAWDVYEAHCRFRNHRLRVSRASREKIVEFTGLSPSGVKNATRELKLKRWISEDARGVHLLVGDFSPVNKGAPPVGASVEAGPPESRREGPQTRPGQPDLRPRAYMDRARGSDQHSDQQETSLADREGFMRRHRPRSHAPPRSNVGASMSAVEERIAELEEKRRARATGGT